MYYEAILMSFCQSQFPVKNIIFFCFDFGRHNHSWKLSWSHHQPFQPQRVSIKHVMWTWYTFCGISINLQMWMYACFAEMLTANIWFSLLSSKYKSSLMLCCGVARGTKSTKVPHRCSTVQMQFSINLTF